MSTIDIQFSLQYMRTITRASLEALTKFPMIDLHYYIFPYFFQLWIHKIWTHLMILLKLYPSIYFWNAIIHINNILYIYNSLDTNELKNLLRKHKNVFTEEEIVEIGELFYAGKSGGSVPFDRFVEAIDRVVQLEERDDITRDFEGNPLQIGSCGNEYLFYKSHSNYTKDDVQNIKLTHLKPQSIRDQIALNCVKGVRYLFDKATSWSYGDITKDKILNRTIFLETVAAVPGMVAAIVRHFKSLRRMERDGGMLQMFLDEA